LVISSYFVDFPLNIYPVLRIVRWSANPQYFSTAATTAFLQFRKRMNHDLHYVMSCRGDGGKSPRTMNHSARSVIHGVASMRFGRLGTSRTRFSRCPRKSHLATSGRQPATARHAVGERLRGRLSCLTFTCERRHTFVWLSSQSFAFRKKSRGILMKVQHPKNNRIRWFPDPQTREFCVRR
ncbi:hypothetical protein KCU72_g3, partial [Aureobasidium melanogenum]